MSGVDVDAEHTNLGNLDQVLAKPTAGDERNAYEALARIASVVGAMHLSPELTAGMAPPGTVAEIEAAVYRRINELQAEVRGMEETIDFWESSAEMGCENPPEGCECPGCSLARSASKEEA